jgi:hypothetical protein
MAMHEEEDITFYPVDSSNRKYELERDLELILYPHHAPVVAMAGRLLEEALRETDVKASEEVVRMDERLLIPGPLHKSIICMQSGETIVVDAKAAAAERPAPDIDKLWGDTQEEKGRVQSAEGAILSTVRTRGLTYLVSPAQGSRMTPGFGNIDAIGNAGMVCSTLSSRYIVTAGDERQAYQRYLERSADEGDILVYPLFLNAAEFRIARFDKRQCRMENYNDLLQYLNEL